jgi:hypothetical protein
MNAFVKVKLADVRIANHRHGPEALANHRPFFKRMERVLSLASPMSAEMNEDAFRRDMHPEREICFWTRICDTFDYCENMVGKKPEKHRELLGILLDAGTHGPNIILRRGCRLSHPQVTRALNFFFRQGFEPMASVIVQTVTCPECRKTTPLQDGAKRVACMGCGQVMIRQQ